MWDRIRTIFLAAISGAFLKRGVDGFINHRADYVVFVDSAAENGWGRSADPLYLSVAFVLLALFGLLCVYARLRRGLPTT